MPTRQRRQHKAQAMGAQQCQQRHFGQQRQHQRQAAKCTDVRVLHDLQRPVAVQAAAQSIGYVGKPVFVQSTGQPDGGSGAEDGCHQRRAGYQQALSGIVMHILGLMYYRDKTRDFEDEELINKINKAKVVMRESVYKNITAEEIAKSLNICYSGFRRAFKEFTGTSPSKYMVELKLNEAKLLLSTTSQSVKQIANTLNFDNLDYFPVFFKKRTGFTPSEYRCNADIKSEDE